LARWPVKRQLESPLMEEEVKASKPSSAAREWMSSATALRVSKLVMSLS